MKTLLGTAKTSGKICEMDGGKEFYEYYFKSRSGTNLSIDEAMEVLETAMIEDIMELQDIYSRLTAAQQAALDSDLEYTNGSFEKDLEFCKNAIKQDFPDLGDVKYIVYHVPESLADNFSPAAYMSSPYDDITKNLLMINDYSDGASDLLPTVGHEAFPGHMYQAVYHRLNMNSFYQKGGTTAYKEGWSTYCEDYIMKLTTYDYDVYRANYVWLMLMINYVAETIMDIGVHYYGWTEKDAANYFDQMLGGLGTALVDSFYDRIIEIPCYCTPYCFGNYFCCKIINDAVAKYGNDYSMMQIHKAYLDMGPSYFELLQEYMPIYVEKQK